MKEQLYLHDVFHELLDRARALRDSVKRTERATVEFEAGRLHGYYEVLSTMINRLDAFGIPRSEVGLPDIINLEKELL